MREKWHFLLFISLLFLSCLFISRPAQALEFGTTHTVVWGNSSSLTTPSSYASFMDVYYNPTDGTKRFYSVAGAGVSSQWTITGSTNVPSAGQITNITLKPTATIPANSLISFNLRFVAPATSAQVEYNGLSGNAIISTSCKNNSIFDGTYDGYADFQCHYLVYTNTAITPSSGISFMGRISVVPSVGLIVLAPEASRIQLVSSGSGGGYTGLTASDMQFLSENFSWIVQSNQDNLAVLNQIKALLQAFPTPEAQAEATAEAIQEVLEEQRETEREELEDNESSLEDESQNAVEQVEQDTQNLTQAIGSIIDVFKNAQPTNCKIPLNTGNFNVGEIDLCQAPTEIRNMISIMVGIPITLAVLHISYELITTYLIHIRKEQE